MLMVSRADIREASYAIVSISEDGNNPSFVPITFSPRSDGRLESVFSLYTVGEQEDPLLQRAYLPEFTAGLGQASQNRNTLLRDINLGLNGDILKASDEQRWRGLTDECKEAVLRFRFQPDELPAHFSVLGMLGVYIHEVHPNESTKTSHIASPQMFIAKRFIDALPQKLVDNEEPPVELEPLYADDGDGLGEIIEEPGFDDKQRIAIAASIMGLLLDAEHLPDTTLWNELFIPTDLIGKV
jgi:hypothetical protein